MIQLHTAFHCAERIDYPQHEREATSEGATFVGDVSLHHSQFTYRKQMNPPDGGTMQSSNVPVEEGGEGTEILQLFLESSRCTEFF